MMSKGSVWDEDFSGKREYQSRDAPPTVATTSDLLTSQILLRKGRDDLEFNVVRMHETKHNGKTAPVPALQSLCRPFHVEPTLQLPLVDG